MGEFDIRDGCESGIMVEINCGDILVYSQCDYIR